MPLDRAVAAVAAGALLAGATAMAGPAHAVPGALGRLPAAPAQDLGPGQLGLDELGLDELGLIGDSSNGSVQRAGGGGRVATGVAASEGFRDTAETALLATATEFPDALAATALAGRMDAPLLLTHHDQLPQAVAAELSRLGVQRTVLLGGTGAIGQPVAADLAERGYDVNRVAGDHRFATAAEVARAVGASQRGEVLLALGAHPQADQAWPDAVASSALAATGGNPPTLLTAHGHLPQATREALTDLDAQRVLLVGGEAAIPPDIVSEVESLGLETERLAGPSRYATSRQVAEAAMARRSADAQPLVLATGESFPDALAAGALADALGGTLALTPSGQLAGTIDEFVRANADTWEGGVVVGGPAAASDTVIDQLEAALNEEPRPDAGDATAPDSDTAPEGGDGSGEQPTALVPTPEATPTPDGASEPEPAPEDGSSSEPEPAPEEGSPDPEPDDGGATGEILATFEGQASWYGANFHGQQTACGEVFDMHELTAAHRQLPCGARVRVTNLSNGEQVTVTVNDHGPQVGDRVMDLSRAAAAEIGMRSTGTAPIRGEVLAD